MHLSLSLALWSQSAAAAVLSAPTATITAQPVLEKKAVTTVGYYSTGSEFGTTLWGTVTFETQGAMVAASGSLFAFCASNSCNFGSCRGSTYMLSTTSVDCGSASSLTCSSNVLYTDINDKSPLTNFFCDSATETGFVLYKVTPTDGPASSSLRRSSFISASETDSIDQFVFPTASDSDSDSTPLQTSGPVSRPTKSKKSTPIGAIVGGVVGGIAVLGALAVGAFFLMRRNRKAATPPPQTYPQQTYVPAPQSDYKPYAGMQTAPPPEKTPAATYPYAVEVGGAPAPAPPLSPGPVPQYTPSNGAMNELPAQRM